jgi:signal transduction histidine kinase
MKEVSCILLDTVFHGLERKKISADIVCSGIPYDMKYLRDKNERIEWDVFCRIVENLKTVLDDKGFEGLGDYVGRTRFWDPHITIAKILFTPTKLYWWWSSPSKHGGGKKVVSCIEPVVKKMGENHMRITLTIQDGYRDCPEFFMVTKNGFAFVPVIFGGKPAVVDMQKIDRGAVYDIYYSETGGLLSRLRNACMRPFDARAAARSLKEANNVLLDRYRQLEKAKELLQTQAAELKAACDAREQMQREFTRLQIESQEAERKRLASELHDGLGQNLLVVGNELRQYLCEQDGPHDDLQRVAALVQESVDTVRDISSMLHPHQLERLGFRAAIDAMTENVSHSAGLNVECEFDESVDHLPADSEIHVYRTIQEALANVVRHASASRATIRVRKAPETIDVVISDDGIGFHVPEAVEPPDSTAAVKCGKGFGLASMRERARIIGAALTITSSPSSGTTIHLRLPRS